MTGAQSALFAEQPITEFRGEYRFLSNFYVHEPVPPVSRVAYWMHEVSWAGGPGFKSVEHAFQAAKVEPGTEGAVEHYRRICEAEEPGDAKRLGSPPAFLGHGVTLRRGWDQVKVPVMLACLRGKFAPERDLAGLLVSTSPRVLVEGNTWGDDYWGVVRGGRGKNMLGRLLMLVRAELLCARAAGMRVEELR